MSGKRSQPDLPNALGERLEGVDFVEKLDRNHFDRVGVVIVGKILLCEGISLRIRASLQDQKQILLRRAALKGLIPARPEFFNTIDPKQSFAARETNVRSRAFSGHLIS